eukprot:gene8165-9598_t
MSDSMFIYLLLGDADTAGILFEVFELFGIITYYCMYGMVLFSWVEVVFRVEHLGHGEEKVRKWRNIFCVFTSVWVLSIFTVSELFVNINKQFAIMVFGIGLAVISLFSFGLSIAFIVYWVKLHRMVSSIKLATTSNRKTFLYKVAILAIIFILCLDAKIVHYFINIREPFQSSIWDLYALNYLPEAIAVTVALYFFGSSITAVAEDDNSYTFTETERANRRRRDEKKTLLLSVDDDSDHSINDSIQ